MDTIVPHITQCVQMQHESEEKMDTSEVDGNTDNQSFQPHPLLIDHVVESILQHLVKQNNDDRVLQSRLVCRLWDEIATSTLRFNSSKTVHFGKYFRSPETLMKFVQYLQESGSINHFPIGKFYLCEDIFKQCHFHIVQTFFTECANILTSLTIRLDNQSDLKVAELNFGEVNLPYLKSLVFDDRRVLGGIVSENASNGENVTLLEVLVKGSPRLQQLTVIHPRSSMFDDEETANTRRIASERHVAEMLVTKCPPNLTALTLDIKLNDRVLRTLSEIPANLRDLKISLRESIFSKESLGQLLENQKNSLRSLRLYSMGTKSHFEITLPVLQNLRLLELHSWDCQIQGVTFSSFTYESHFPALQSLVLHTWAENPSWIKFFPAAYYGTVPSVTNLKLPQNFLYPAMIQNLSWLYPNLKSLDLHFSKQTLVIIQRVFKHFRDHLEELKIRDSLPREKFDICLDPLFTGLPLSVCEKILRNKYFNPNEESNHLLKLRQKPTMLNLINLRKLDIEDLLRHETYVTDVTAYLVILQMPSLRYLNMGRSQIDDECLGHLAKKFPCNMEKELLVPKPTQKIVMMNSAKATLMTAYHYCTSSLDLPYNCAIC